jgi:hypothetical protein
MGKKIVAHTENYYHYGEIFAEFWKMNVDAPYYSYLAYAKEKAA